jgi:hypothetical protein
MIYQVMSGYQDQDGDTSGALETIGRAIALSEESLALWRPEEHDGRGLVAYCLEAAAGIRLSARQPDEAMASARRAVALREELFRDKPGDKATLANLAGALLAVGNTHRDIGDPVEVRRVLERAKALLESLKSPGQIELVKLARANALLSVCPSPGGPPPTPEGQAQRRALADRAMDYLRRATRAGFWDVGWIRKDRALDPLRARADFQAVVNDLAFPADPFAAAGPVP